MLNQQKFLPTESSPKVRHRKRGRRRDKRRSRTAIFSVKTAQK